MKKFLAAVIAAGALALASVMPAAAQSSPNLITGQVPTAAQWNGYFAAKQDVLGYTPLNQAGGTMSGRLVTAAPGATLSGFNLIPGTAPGSPANGDLWATNSGLFAQIGGATYNVTTPGDSSSEIWLATGQSNFDVDRPFSWTPPSNAFVWNNSTGTCINTGTAFTALSPTTITPEASFIADRALHFPNKKIYLVRIAYNDQPIAQWLPGAVDNCPTPATLQDMYTKSVNNVVPALAAAGLTKLTGILWWQGETDGIHGSTTWVSDFESVVARYKTNSWYPSAANTVPNWIMFGIAGRMQKTTLATADAFNQTYILPAANNDPFYRMFVNTAAFPVAFWDTTIIPGHMTGQGYYEAGTVASRSLYTNVPDGYVFFGGNSVPALNGTPPAAQCSQNVFTCLNNNIVTPFVAPPTGTIAHLIQRDGVPNVLAGDAYSLGVGFTMIGRYAGGTALAPTATPSNIITFQLAGRGYDASTGFNSHSRIAFKTFNAQSATDHSGTVVVSTTPSGSTTLADVAWFQPSGGFALGVNVDPGRGSIEISNNTAATAAVLADTAAHFVGADSGSPIVDIDAFSGIPTYLTRYAGGTNASKLAAGAGVGIGQFGALSWDGTGFNTNASFRFKTVNAQTGSDHSGKIVGVTIPTGSTSLTEAFFFEPSGAFSVGQDVDSGAGIINALTGLRIGNAAATAGHVLRANGTNYVDGQLSCSDLSTPCITGNQTITLSGDVTGSGPTAITTTLATAQPAVHTWALAQTFTVAPVFTDQSGSRTALGLGTAATQNTGTSGANVPLLNGVNTWSGVQTLSTPVINGLPTGTGVAAGNTASALVARDGSGNFSAGTITASLTGHSSLDLALTGGTLSGNITFSPDTAGIAGSTSGNGAASNVVGETITATAGTQAMASATLVNLITQSLTAGIWEVTCQNTFNFTNAATTMQNLAVGVSTTSATFGSDLNSFNFGANSTLTPDNGGVAGFTLNSPSTQVKLSGTANVFCVGFMTYGVSTAQSGGARFKAVRIH